MRRSVRRLVVALAIVSTAWAEGFPSFEELRARARTLWDAERGSRQEYVILARAKSPLLPAANMLATYRKAEIVGFDPSNPTAVLEELIRREARYVAVFVEPREMDVNLLRTFIVLSTLIDEDPFCDFAFGFVTASTPAEAEAFVERMIRADRSGVEPYAVHIAISNISQEYPGSSFIDGMDGESWYVKEGDKAFAAKALERLDRAGFVHFGGCGDPEGIWMFDDRRNLDSTKHWPYAPERVGSDPKGEMPRLLAADLRRMKLNGAVVWSHVCHQGAVGRIYVERDIVSTFGRSDYVEEYMMPSDRSVALAIIESGASAYICPVGANFGAQSDIEQSFASETGAPLGDVMRRAYHDIVMDTDGHPEQIGLFAKGRPAYSNPDGFLNNNSPHNRCLYGDPMLAPFAKRRSPATVEIQAKEEVGGLALRFRVAASGWLGRTWYGNRGGDPGRGRIYEAIPLSQDVKEVSIREVRALDKDRKPFRVIRKNALLERIDGKTLVHLQIVTDADGALSNEGATVEVFVKFGKTAPATVPSGDRSPGR